MLRATLALTAAVALFGVAQPAQAQIFGPSYGYNYSYNYNYRYGTPYYGGYYGNPYQREYGYGYNTYRPYYGYPQYNYYQPSYSVPSTTGSALQGGNNGNYWYWLQQQANQGRIPQSEVNRRMYGR